nr:hypothetical protein [Streptomyces antibioticus]
MTLIARAQQPMPSHPRRRDGKTPLPVPEECARLRRAWGLSVEHVAGAFGVTTATVRSWEAGRTAPTGLRRAAYAAFLSGLAQGLVPAPGQAGAAVSPRTGSGRRRRPVPTATARPAASAVLGEVRAEVPAARPARVVSAVLTTRTAGEARHLPVGPGPDPVTPARRRRLRTVALAAGVWTAFLHLMTTMPVPHP